MTEFARGPLVVFSDDWGRHPSSCQHLVRHLLPHRRVIWVNTIGTRPPKLDLHTVQRAFEKGRDWLKRTPRPETAPDNPLVVSPKMWPSFRSGFTRAINRRLLVRAVKPLIDALPEPPVCLSTLPLVADLPGQFPARKWVYYCVDDFSVWPGYDGATMARMERDFLPKCDEIVAVSDTLVTHLKSLGRDSHLLTHGVDLEFWQTIRPPNEVFFAGLEPPFVVFWGVIDRRMDVPFVKRLAESLDRGTVVLIGPQDHPDPALLTTNRVAVRPAQPFDRLPGIAAAAAVLVMPYADLPVTRAMQPLKLKEYLATGKPVVVRDLPATRDWADACDVARTADQFAGLVRERLVTGLPAHQKEARNRLAQEGWAAKAAMLDGWLG